MSAAVRRYRQDLVAKYTKVAVEQGAAGSLATWFQTHRSSLEKDGALEWTCRSIDRESKRLPASCRD